MQTAKLENWYIENYKLHGRVYGHAKMVDGATIATTMIVGINYDLKEVTTVNTRYTLGAISPRYYMLAADLAEITMMEKLFGKRAWEGNN